MYISQKPAGQGAALKKAGTNPTPASQASAPAADQTPVDRLPDLSTIAKRAEATSAEAKEAAKDNPDGEKSGWQKAGTAALLGVAGLGALAATAQPAQAADVDIGVHIDPWGNVGVGVHIGKNRHHRRRHGNHGHHGRHRHRDHGHHGHHRHRDWGHDHGGYWAIGADGMQHYFDSHGHVNDATGHYNLEMDAWGRIYRTPAYHHH